MQDNNITHNICFIFSFSPASSAANVDKNNPTIAYCRVDNEFRKRTTSGICRDNTPLQSDVKMTTDEVIAIADFAITVEELPPLPIELIPQRIMYRSLF